MKHSCKRVVTLFLAIVMLFSVSEEGLAAVAANPQENAYLLPVQVLPDMDYVEGMPYIGIATAGGSVEEAGSYLLTVRRTGDVTLGSTVELRTVDISAGYGRDYEIDDPTWKTEVFPHTETLVKQYGDEANRLAAAQTLTELGQRISESAAAEENAADTGSAVTTEPESELARLKMEQTGLPVRQTTEDSGDMLPPELQSLLMEVTDVAELLDASSATKLTFAPGETEKTVRFCVLEDAESEGQEMISFLLAYPDDDTAMIEAVRSVSVIIEDDEPVERSRVSFTQASYSAGTEKATLLLQREGAEYSYAAVGVRTADGTAIGGVHYEPLDVTVNFAQFQTTATVEVPVAPGLEPTEFSVELYDYRGIDPGETAAARVTVPGSAQPDGNAVLMDAPRTIRVWVDGMPRECSIGYFDSNGWASLTCTYDGRRFEVGKYRLATALDYSWQQDGKGSMTHQIEGDHYHLKVYNSNVGSKGYSAAFFRVFSSDEPSRYYSSMYVDYETFSGHEGSEFSLYSVQGFNKSFVTGKHSRTVGLGVTIPHFNWGYPVYGSESCEVRVEKTQRLLIQPDANVYGFVVLYQAFDISVENPAPLEYASGTLDENGKRVTEQRLPAKTHLASPARTYSKQYITIGEEPTDDNGCIYGELKGYDITPQGGSTFFYATNSKTIHLDADLIKQINDHSGNMMPDLQQSQGQGFRDFHTSITIKPVYGYKDVVVELLAPDAGNVTYLDNDLQAAWSGSKTLNSVFHVGDRINPTVTPTDDGLYYTGYWRYAYKNPGDTGYDTSISGHVQADTTPVTTLTRARTVLRPVLESMDNFIEIRMDADAQKYFALSGLVAQDKLTEAYMKGKNVLNCGTDAAPETKPVVGQAYTVLLTATDYNDGTWRPKITIRQKGATVNGFAADFVAADNAAGNVIEVTAERFAPDALQYYAVTGSAVYESYSIRDSSASLVGVPAVGAIVKAGAESVHKATVRMNSPTGDDGTFTVAGLRALSGDTVSVLIDNNDIRQVAYVTLNASRTEQMIVDTILPSKDPKYDYSTETKLETVILQTMPVTAMPIRTGYSPYVTYISYGYSNADIGSTESNEIPIKQGSGNNLILSVYVNLNGVAATDLKKVTVIKRDVLGTETTCDIEKMSEDPWKTNCWEASVPGDTLHDGDEFWVQLVVGSTTYPKVKTGLSCYSTAEAPVEQRFTYELPTPYEGLPIINTLTGTLDSGVCNWQTIYLDKDNPGSSPYAQLITMTISGNDKLDPNDALAKYNKLKGLQYKDHLDVWDTMDDTVFGQPSKEEVEGALKIAQDQTEHDDEYCANLKGDALAKLKEPKISGKIEFLLQLEYDYDPVKAKHFYAGGQYLISFTINVNSTIYWSAMGVPMYVNLSGSTSIQFDGRYATEAEKQYAEELGKKQDLAKAIPSEKPYFQWTFKAAAQPGVGIYGVLGVRGVVSFAMLARVNISKGGTSLGGSYGALSGGFGVDLVLFSFTKAWPMATWKSGVFNKSGAKNAMLMADAAEGAPVSLRAFDAGEERAQNTRLRSTLTPQTRTTLIDGAMEYVRPQLVDLGDGRTMLLFLRKTADDGRDQDNAATLVYAIRNADGTWEKDVYGNIASTAVELDGQADSVPAAYRVGDTVYIAWTNAEIVGTDSFGAASESLKNAQIHLASYDIPTGSVSDVYAVTDDTYVNSYAHIIERQGYIVLYYFKRDIGQAQGIDDLASLTENYCTWALRIFDPATGEFIGDEELLYAKHPAVLDPLVFNLETGQYAYTDGHGVTKKYGIISYIADTDGDLTTAADRELWAIVRNQTDGKAYYPVKIDSGEASLSDARLTEQGGELYLTWLTDGTTLNTLCASDIWDSLDSTFGSEDGTGEHTALELIRDLSGEQIGNYRWNQLPYLAQPEEVRDGEFYTVLANLAFERFPVMRQELADSDPASSDAVSRTLGNHRIVAGADGNLYYFWTEPSEDGMGQELYGAAFYAGPAENGEGSRRTWSKPVQLTDYGLAIDELAIEVNADNGATMIANLFKQFLDDEEGIAFGPHRLTEIGFVPGSSLVIEDRRILLSDEYPIPGETVTAFFGVTNLGLLPAERFQLTLDGETEVVGRTVLPGENMTLTAEKIAGDGTLSFTAGVQELDETQLLTVKAGNANTATVAAKTGWALDFGSPEIITYNEAADQVGPLLRELMDQSGKEWNDREVLSRVAASVDPKYMAILNTLNCAPEQKQKADLYVVIPVTNVGNRPAEGITFAAAEMHEELRDSDDGAINVLVEGDKVGAGTLDAAPVKTLGENGVETKTVYVAVPLVGFNIQEDMSSLGRVEIKLAAEKDGEVIDDTLHASRQITRNVLLQVNGGAEEIALIAGELEALDIQEYPFNSLKRLSYEIEDGTVAAVTQDGRITGLREGTTVLTVTDVGQPRLTKQLNVTVKAPRPDAPDIPDDPITPGAQTQAATAVAVFSDEGSVSVTVGVRDGTAAITAPTQAQLAQITDKAGETGSVTIDLSSLPETVTAVTIPAETVKAINEAMEAGGAGLTVRLPNSTVTFDAEALASVAAGTTGADLKLCVAPAAETKLNEKQQDAIAGLDVQAVYDVYLVSGGKRITDFGGGKAAIEVTCTVKDGLQPGGIVVWYVTDGGEKTRVPATATQEIVKWTVTHFSNYVLAYDKTLPGACAKDDACPLTAFTDLDKSSWYHDGVHWALENDIMSGYGGGLFGPGDATSRAMIVTMLWRMEGEPVVNYAMRFADVPSDAWFTEAVRWAASEKIVEGYSTESFGPNDSVTREQLAAILYRCAKARGQGFSGMWAFPLTFDDASEVSGWANEAVCWMTMQGVIQGTGDNKLSPKGTANRAQVAAMLMRYDSITQ